MIVLTGYPKQSAERGAYESGRGPVPDEALLTGRLGTPRRTATTREALCMKTVENLRVLIFMSLVATVSILAASSVVRWGAVRQDIGIEFVSLWSSGIL